MNEPSIDFVYPDDEPATEENSYREASKRGLRVINIAISYILESDSPRMASWAVAYALGLDAICEGQSMTQRMRAMGMSPQALSKYTKEFQNEINLNNNSYTYGNTKNRH